MRWWANEESGRWQTVCLCLEDLLVILGRHVGACSVDIHRSKMLKTNGDCSFTRLGIEARKGAECPNVNTNSSFVFCRKLEASQTLELCASTEKMAFGVPEVLGPAQ